MTYEYDGGEMLCGCRGDRVCGWHKAEQIGRAVNTGCVSIPERDAKVLLAELTALRKERDARPAVCKQQLITLLRRVCNMHNSPVGIVTDVARKMLRDMGEPDPWAATQGGSDDG